MILSAFLLLMTLMTNVVSNNAAAAIGTPIGISIAAQLGASPEPFILAVIFGANYYDTHTEPGGDDLIPFHTIWWKDLTAPNSDPVELYRGRSAEVRVAQRQVRQRVTNIDTLLALHENRYRIFRPR